MKSIFKILVLGVVPILMATAVVDQGLAADKGSQLLFIADTGVNMRSYMMESGPMMGMDGMDMEGMSVSATTGMTRAMNQNFISITNTASSGNPSKKANALTAVAGRAVTVLFQYYNDETELVLYFLRVLRGGETVLVDPFDHEIPGTATLDDDGMEMAGTATTVREVLFDIIPAMTFTDAKKRKRHGFNSGRFVITVTAVGADSDAAKAGKQATTGTDGSGRDTTDIDILFPDFLVKGMHRIDNIDEVGKGYPDTVAADGTASNTGALALGGADHDFGLFAADDTATTDVNELNEPDPDSRESEAANTTKNVGALTVDTAEPIAFNHLTGHHTTAQTSSIAGGADQTASWAVTALARPALMDMATLSADQTSVVADTTAPDLDTDTPATEAVKRDLVDQARGMIMPDYVVLDGDDSETDPTDAEDDGDAVPADGGDDDHLNRRLAAKHAGGSYVRNLADKSIGTRGGTDGAGANTVAETKRMGDASDNWVISGGALVWSSLHATAHEDQMVHFLSVADDGYGTPGGYKLISAKTQYKVNLRDNMTNLLPAPKSDSNRFGGVDDPDEPAGLAILVEGLGVWIGAADCEQPDEDMRDGWSLANLTEIVPEAATGTKKFAGLDAMAMDPAKNSSSGWVAFKRDDSLSCSDNFGDGDPPTSTAEVDDDIVAVDKRTFTGGTLVVEYTETARTFVTVGQVVLRYNTPASTFGASWWLASPPAK